MLIGIYECGTLKLLLKTYSIEENINRKANHIHKRNKSNSKRGERAVTLIADYLAVPMLSSYCFMTLNSFYM